MENNMDEKQSLQIISQMINTAKNKLGNNSFYFLVWGWATFIAAVTHYILMINSFENSFLPWPILMSATTFIVIIYSYKNKKPMHAQSYIENFIATLWIVTGVAIFITLLLITQLGGFRASYVGVMLLYGLGTLVTGIIIRFNPLIAGGIFIWACCVLMYWVDFPNALLVIAASVLGGYIIPGFMLKNKREKN